MKNILITGGAGFIGSHLVKHFVKKYKNYNIINVDNLTYASNIDFLNEINNFKITLLFKLIYATLIKLKKFSLIIKFLM